MGTRAVSGSVSGSFVAPGTPKLDLFCFYIEGPAPGVQPVFLPCAKMSGAAPAPDTVMVSRSKERVKEPAGKSTVAFLEPRPYGGREADVSWRPAQAAPTRAPGLEETSVYPIIPSCVGPGPTIGNAVRPKRRPSFLVSLSLNSGLR